MHKTRPPLLSLLAIGLTSITLAITPAITLAGAADGDVNRGAAGWTREYPQADGTPARSCVTCHTADLTQPGKQINTGKAIGPLAPSVDRERLTDPAKVEKWLTRNCRWTLGRECTASEKADFIAYIRTQ